MEKIIFITIFGFIWGSFLNVVIYRLPREISLLKPSSFCPQCKSKIKFYDNIPFLSFLWLKGRCRSCKARISFSYSFVEFLTPLCFLLLYNRYSFNLAFLASCLFTSALIILGFIDLYHQILPDEIILPGLCLALIYSLFRQDLNLTQALIGAVSGASFLLLVYGMYFLLRKKEALGMGDVTLMLLLGAFLGWRQSFFTLLLASFTGALAGILLILFKKKSLQFSLPFGTFLALSAFISLLWGEKIIDAYLSYFRNLLL